MDVLMPQLGETVAEGKITTWFKSVGDPVKSGDNLFEIETDKVSMEVPSITAGVLAEIRVKEGEVAPVGEIVAVIADSVGAAVPVSAGTAAAAPQLKSSVPQLKTHVKLDPFKEVHTPERNFGPAKLANGVLVTPLARRLAGEAGIDLSRVRGSGPYGRIIANDVQAAMASGVGPAAAPAPIALGASADQVKALYRDVPFEEVQLDAMRRTIAKRLVEATQTIPHFYLSADVEIERLMQLREEVNATAQRQRDGTSSFKLSVNDFIVKAFAIALQRIPNANAVWAGDRILRFQHSDIGVAVAIEGGLLTPVIRQAETKPVFAISTEMKDLAARARERKLKPQEYQGGSTAISNLGMYGISAFSAIINPPHATILAVGAGLRRPVEAASGGIRFTTQMTVTLSCDHRVVDGALGAQLLAAFKAVMESPVTMLI
jgi:pyruvate dehydrogenase E2 component (dihydrolipoyllysine-residue acetyltransferase)